MKTRLTQIAAITMVVCANAQAQQATEINAVTVTASPIIESNNVDAFSNFTTKVSDTQVRDLGALDLPAALRMTPGVQTSRFNEVGSYSGNQGGSVYIRGLGASRPGSEIKTYLDGVPLYMGIWNHPLMDLIPLNGVGSIEIDKGPNPMHSGNNLAAINLQTKRATREGNQGEMNASVGSFGTRLLQANTVGRNGDIDYSFAAGDIKSNGARANGDASLQNAMGKLTRKIDQNWSFGGSFLAVTNTVGDPGKNTLSTYAYNPMLNDPTPKSNGLARNSSNTNLVTAFLSHQHDGWKGELKIYQNTGNNDIDQDPSWGTFKSKFNMSGLKWREEFAPWQNGKMIAGLDQDSVSGSITGPYVGGTVGDPAAWVTAGTADVPTFKITSPYVGYSHQVQMNDGWVFQPSLGLRSYTSNVYNSKTAPNIGASLSNERTTLYGNYTQGILYPGAETYSLTRTLPALFAVNNGWNTIKPTEDKHTEVGVKQAISKGTQIDFSIFQDQISNRYSWSAGTGVWGNTLPDYKINGAELSISHEINSQWKTFGGVTTLNSSGLDSSNQLPYAPKTAISAGVTGLVNGYKLSVDAQHQTSMYSLNQDRGGYTASQVSAFTVANARVAYPMATLGKRGEIYAQINNLFNADYQYNSGYPMPGRNYRVGLIASF
jgi:outer membrane cobalamin receptor